MERPEQRGGHLDQGDVDVLGVGHRCVVVAQLGKGASGLHPGGATPDDHYPQVTFATVVRGSLQLGQHLVSYRECLGRLLQRYRVVGSSSHPEVVRGRPGRNHQVVVVACRPPRSRKVLASWSIVRTTPFRNRRLSWRERAER